MSAGGSVRLMVTGPLARFEVEFRADLARLGYATSSIGGAVRAMAGLSRWLEDRALAPSGLTPQLVVDVRIVQLGTVLRFLRELGEVPAADSVAEAGSVEAMLVEFRAWLAGERGLSAATVCSYGKQARTFLARLPEPVDVALGQLDAGQVISFMLGYCRDCNTGSATVMVTAVRALLRFLHVVGYVAVSLAAAVPAVAGWRLASLPCRLDAAGVGRLLGSCDRDTIAGRRDFAVLTVLARLGLRGAEVAALELGDIDWRGGEVTVCGKGNRIERLPLPVDVGEALAGYVTGGRARCDSRAVFVTVHAPYRCLSPGAVRAIMGRVCQRAGLDRVGAHRLRHFWLPRCSAPDRRYPRWGRCCGTAAS